MKARKSQIGESVTRHFPTSSVGKMGWLFNNVAGLFEAIGITCNPSERLFIYSSSRSLKAVLRHNGNNCPSLPMAHSVHLKGDYTSVKMLLSALKYDDYGLVIGYFKMVSFPMGLQGGFTKFPCFLCLKNSITKT